MLKRFVIGAIVILGAARQVHAFCVPGDIQACFVNGVPGTRECGPDARFGPCIPGFAPPVHGVVISNSDASVAGLEVVVVADGIGYRTFTDATGEFRVFAPEATALQVQVGGTQLSAASSGHPIVVTVP